MTDAPLPDSATARSHASIAALTATVARLPSDLSAALEVALPSMPAPAGHIVTTGLGASEPPARLLASLLVRAGISARFCATSEFARPEPPQGALLVVFSQGLSPNALLAMGEEHGFTRRWLVTAVGPGTPCRDKLGLRARLEARGIEVVWLPPAEEPAWLVRIAGPTVAALGAIRLAAALTGDANLHAEAIRAPDAYSQGSTPDRVHAAASARALPDHPLALIALAAPLEGALAHRCKLMETLLVPEPPVWDVLQFAHGPLQAYFLQPLTLLVLEGPGDGALVARLADTLDPARHTLRRLIAPSDGASALFCHAAMVDALLVASLHEHPRDLLDWPAKHGDASLYALGTSS